MGYPGFIIQNADPSIEKVIGYAASPPANFVKFLPVVNEMIK